jgi:FtsH-binding integral membrane protein
VCVLVFAIAGKNSHEASSPDWVILAIMWPFAVAVMVGHAGVLMRQRRARRTWPEGVVVLSATYLLGMLLRVISGRGIAAGFLVVAVLFLALTMLGWRALLRLAMNRRTSRAT